MFTILQVFGQFVCNFYKTGVHAIYVVLNESYIFLYLDI